MVWVGRLGVLVCGFVVIGLEILGVGGGQRGVGRRVWVGALGGATEDFVGLDFVGAIHQGLVDLLDVKIRLLVFSRFGFWTLGFIGFLLWGFV